MTDPAQIDVIAPNFKRRLSGVTSTVIRLVPLQARNIAIATTGPALPAEMPQIPPSKLLLMSRRGPSGARVWHARRNIEMLAGLALKHLLRKRLRLVFTSASQRNHTGLTKWLIRRMDAVIATSEKTAKYLERPATVIRHGIDTDGFCPADDKPALRRDLGLPETGPIIGCYGRIRAQKGTDAFVDAMLRVLPDHPDATAIVMGRATEKHQGFEQGLKTRVAQAGMSDRLLFLPEVPVWEMARWYQALDLYIAPQRWEGFGLTPLEAMACAVPVIATRVGAFDELVIDGETGALIDAGDVAQMAHATDAILRDPPRLEQWSRSALRRVRDHFRIEQEAAAITAIYRDLLARG
ncbi:glycosyltransferase family 4 protein [Lutimaribacter sp. EGI FJ00015]|uniref:Glycosyltransferase family 4 protein n=1 Tax=Lutimaribacter degradans TaxID=2945989 RepID=A0ACC5ZSC2_9RHOB|nr:glycosyltransferase family 4 protein [Lutimaribacter sp. EGI FJ00013]MCM2560838.1 glycosyltransferase family 4 protein [Lutimaribacter sp. EGI FJ00013]MCO0612217.1 glycosyltransferase family 4 protein [Lutimaribacter sp. EGI FJ00015]MCO0634663.1 glycosyltransferase family 4 protein [Lutimaribacter sp. EGI FJ00014]